MEQKGVAQPMLQHAGNKCTKQAGFALIEVLVTVAIVAVALLGLVSLDGISKLSTYEARQRSSAILAANDFIERLRLDKSAWISEKLSSSSSTYSVNITDAASIDLPSCATDSVSTSSDCSAANIVQLDLYNLNQTLFPSNDIQKVVQDAAACLYLSRTSSSNLFEATLVVSWQDRQSLSDAATTNEANSSSTVTTTISGCGTSGDKRRQYLIKTVI